MDLEHYCQHEEDARPRDEEDLCMTKLESDAYSKRSLVAASLARAALYWYTMVWMIGDSTLGWCSRSDTVRAKKDVVPRDAQRTLSWPCRMPLRTARESH
jgi:hypothetical protein